jgi:rod shape-determining protein MreD
MHNWFAILSTIFIALILTFLPMPDWTIWLRPNWVLLVLIYWAIMAPNRVGVGVAWFTGLTLDLLNGTLLGEHALVFTLIIYFVSRLHIRLRMSPLLQQGFSVAVFVLVAQLLIYCVQGMIGERPNNQLYWLSVITSTLLWPWLFVLLRDSKRWFKTT